MKKQKIITKNNNGITLIALVVTIIILLILAGISLSLVAGSNGIIGKAVTAREEHTKGQEKESIELAFTSAFMSNEDWNGKINAEDLQDELEKSGIQAGVVEDEDGNIRVTIDDTKNVYIVDPETGKVDYIGTIDADNDIELQERDLSITASTTDWTNENVAITIKVQDGIDLTGHVIQYKTTTDTSWNDYSGAITLSKNDIITARVRNNLTGQSKLTASLNISKIDKLEPSGTLAVASKTNTATLTITASDAKATTEYGCSGMKGYYYSKDDGATYTDLIADGSYTFTGLTQNKEYLYKVKIEDNAGNMTEASAKGTTGNVEAASSSNVSYSTTWNGTNAVVTFTTTTDFTIEVSTDNINWTTQNPITVASGTQIYVRLTDTTNSGTSYAALKPVWTGTVSYNANSGTGSVPENQSVEHNKIVTVNFATLPTRTGYTFAGWNTKADGTGTNYTSSGTKTFTMGTSNVVLYAQWTINQYTVNYNSNGGSGSVPSQQRQNYNTTVNVSFSPLPTKSGYNFLGWSTNSGATSATYTSSGAKTFTLTGNVTLYAVWKEIPKATAAISTSNYGDTVNYSANGVTDWKIFYNDGTYIYLIISGYLPAEKVPTSSTGITTVNGYGVKWESRPDFQSGWSTYKDSFMMTDYSLVANDAYGSNSHYVSTLLNAANWSAFANGMSGSTSLEGVAIGSPTLQMLLKSASEKGYGSVTYKTFSHGYNNFSDYSLCGALNDVLYYPGKVGCSGYKLSAPAHYGTGSYNSYHSYLVQVESGGKISVIGSPTNGSWGLRPVVRLPANITAVKSGNTWTFSK